MRTHIQSQKKKLSPDFFFSVGVCRLFSRNFFREILWNYFREILLNYFHEISRNYFREISRNFTNDFAKSEIFFREIPQIFLTEVSPFRFRRIHFRGNPSQFPPSFFLFFFIFFTASLLWTTIVVNCLLFAFTCFFFASLWELLASPWNSQGRQKFCAIVNVYCDPVCTVDDVCSVDVLRILTFGYNRGFLSTSRRSMVSVQNYIARKIGSEFESLDYILHRLDNCTIFAIQSKHLKL